MSYYFRVREWLEVREIKQTAMKTTAALNQQTVTRKIGKIT